MCECRRLLLDRDRVICVLIAQIFYIRREMPEEDCTLKINLLGSRELDKNVTYKRYLRRLPQQSRYLHRQQYQRAIHRLDRTSC